MGSSLYSAPQRNLRSSNLGYQTKSASEIFTQQAKKQAHETMKSQGIALRESRDSATHPDSVPIIMAMDETGSMLHIPLFMVREGLPHIMENIIAAGVPDPQVLFLGIGDHESDHFPLQVGQFESGDAELDMWLTRTFLEGNGGGNGGESYLLAWYFAAFHTVTDRWEKRGLKGFLFTIGDEPCLPTLPARAIQEIMGHAAPEARSWTAQELLAKAQEKYHVFHLNILEGDRGQSSRAYWTALLGERAIHIADHKEVAQKVTNLVTSMVRSEAGFAALHRSAELHLGTPNEDGSIPVQQPINSNESLDSQILL